MLLLESLNNFNVFMEFMKEKPKLVLIREKDIRVIEDLLLDKSFAYLTNIPIISYSDLSSVKKKLNEKSWEKELNSFREFRIELKSYKSGSAAFKSKIFWDFVKGHKEAYLNVVNYEVLHKWKTRKYSKRYSYVSSLGKLSELDLKLCELLVLKSGLPDDYKYKEFETYKLLEKQMYQIKRLRPRLSSRVGDLAGMLYESTEWMMRLDAQYGRVYTAAQRLQRVRERTTRSGVVRDVNSFVRTYKSAERKLAELFKEMIKSYESNMKVTSKHIDR